MASADKKGAALLIGFEPKSSDKGSDSESEYGDPAETACKAAWKAFEKKDYEGFQEALGNWFDAKYDAKKQSGKSEESSEED